MASLKRWLVGSPIRTARLAHERLTKKTALAIFASDALSSTAYATEQILLVLAAAYMAGQRDSFGKVVPISIAISLLLVVVTLSYRQTIHSYPSGGGAFIVAKENLGTIPGLIAGASLLVDYILTVAVSVAAGVEAITSATVGTRFAELHDHRIALCLFFLIFITVANLRGVKEAGSLFAAPSYAFIVSFIFLIGYGLVRYFISPGIAPVPDDADLKIAEGYEPHLLNWFLLLGAFANGCAALTGIEAISNGVQAFKQPEAKNAATTLVWMAVLLIVMFVGVSVLANFFDIHPRHHETVVSQIARAVFTGYLGWFYYIVQATTAAILILAANTAYAGFPRLASLLAKDRFLPRQLANLGDRLVFSNGIILLAVFSGVLIWAFRGDTSRLIPLYAVGVFLSFTLSQTGMVVHFWREGRALEALRGRTISEPSEPGEQKKDSARVATTGRLDPKHLRSLAGTSLTTAEVEKLKKESHWKKSMVISAIGAVATFTVLMVFIITKFTHGAWLVVLVIPLLVILFLKIHRHYLEVAQQLSTEGLSPLRPVHHEVIVPISGIHRGVIEALEYAKSIAPHHVTAVYVNLDDEAARRLREKWEQWGSGVNLVVVASPYRSLARPLLNYVDRVKRTTNGVVTIVLPEFVPAKWWQNLLHNQNTLFLKGALLFKKGIVVTNVPYHLKR
ncbi:MAG: APC family permease [Pyrinomonadaceae bacterium]